MDDKRVSLAEIAPIILNDASQDSKFPNYKIHKCHSKKRDDTQNEESIQDVIDCENVPTIYIETSDEDDVSERSFSGDVERMETQLPLTTDLGSSVDYGREFAYCNIVDFTSEPNIRELTILEYEKNLAKYHDRHSLEQAEQRYNSYKRALVDAYKQKLSEVERLCDEELENIQQNASCLQPFQEIASQWSVDENDHGDSQHGCDNQSESTEPSKIVETSPSNDWCIYGKIDNEVNMIPEILSVRFKRDETT
ncbi:hypothetical protein ALC56_02214 [Trachymyrmex septentrionalis]|uniref:Uncharacterized protein n=1 Tax=Trachymyrmex septentrionalis TaxID=34720 RepID=A0A195FS53_9HYME|nr:hypothetical protein ALC56_02214 [Trachymyrmex septentrionalis]